MSGSIAPLLQPSLRVFELSISVFSKNKRILSVWVFHVNEGKEENSDITKIKFFFLFAAKFSLWLQGGCEIAFFLL